MTDIGVALITGAGSGMGQVMARRLVARGVTVVGLDVNRAGLEETKAGRPNFHAVVADVTDTDAVDQAIADCWRSHGPIDRMVHCAAIMPSSMLIEMDVAVVKRVMKVNYEGTVNVAFATLRRMNERGRGEAIFFGSVAGYVMSPHFGAYSASKAATNMFVEMLIRENKRPDVKIRLVCPPQVDTPLVNQATSQPQTLELAKREGMLRTPDFIIDQVEAASAKDKAFIFPGIETKIMYNMAKFAPNVLWHVIQKAEDGEPLFKW